MIITRTPLRISFVGGGSDLPSYYKNGVGSVISMAINKYIYVSVNKSFSNSVRVAYSIVEECANFQEVRHPLVRNSAKRLNIFDGLEVTSTADIPAKGTGLGSSSAFTVGLLNALNTYKAAVHSKTELAKLACEVEIDMCHEPIGKQDQYAAAFGGINVFSFYKNGNVTRKTIEPNPFNLKQFLDSILIYYTGLTRRAESVLDDQNTKTLNGDNDAILSQMVDLVEPFTASLVSGDVRQCGEILDANWQLKKGLSNKISNDLIDEIYLEAISAGACGGKLLGAGAGGFLLFLAPPEKHRSISERLGKLQQHFWNIDTLGTTVIHHS